MSISKLPPALVVGARYDTFLQRALARFFDRATLETEAVPSPSSDGRLSIDPTDDPGALSVRWFGNRYVLRVPGQRPFTPHEVRFARAIGAVLAARYRAILHPQLMVERGDLFRGAIEDRYVGAFFDSAPYVLPGSDESPPDRLAEVIEILRVAALSSYENQAISSGVLLIDGQPESVGQYPAPDRYWPHYTSALTSIKSFFRLADGLRTLFLVGHNGRLLDIVDVERWAQQSSGGRELEVPCAQAYASHARATLDNKNVCVVLSPGHEIKVFAAGTQVLTFRNADWHLLDLQAKYVLWEAAVGEPVLARRLFQTALDLSDAREGALFVVLRRPLESLAQLVAAPERLDMELVGQHSDASTPSRRHLLHVLAGRTVTELDPSVLSALSTLDGATVTDRSGTLLAAGAILRHPLTSEYTKTSGITEGARTTAALAASRFGPVLKVSEDGMITFYDSGRVWDI
ncbi:MAG: hypothetical protein LC791_05650 [Acidobacteria bacterium]|nr:hypothetical protein [Acidobacteriota bacterium]